MEEDYAQLFLTECDELLSELQDVLSGLDPQAPDAEEIDRAFRAVHSVKGGAAAFDQPQLAAFTHHFEEVMDGLRGTRIALDDTVLDLLVRGSDMMAALIEAARGGPAVPDARIEQVMQGFAGLCPPEADARSPLAEATPPSDEPVDPIEPDAPPGPDPDGNTTVTFRPEPDFLLSGHDPLRMLHAAARIGLIHAEPGGEIPDLDALDPTHCPLTWQLTFRDTPCDVLRDFFSIYDLTARVEGLPDRDAQIAPPATDRHVAEVPRMRGAGQSLRVALSRIDRLVNLVGEIVITQAAVAQRIETAGTGAAGGLTPVIEALSRQVREMQDSVMAIRAQPIKSVFSRMPRIVRDLCETLEREVRIEVSGEETEVDTSVIEQLVEPLTHMIRNSMDHGIEAPEDRIAAGKPRHGLLRLTARHRGERVVITLEDDGRGLDREAILASAIRKGLVDDGHDLMPEEIDNLIFLPGFSTSESVSNISGRGVGMDVVRRKIQGLGGRCVLSSQPGQGTRIQINLPLTLAVLEGMIVQIGQERYVLPLASVTQALEIRPEQLERLPGGNRVVRHKEGWLPVWHLPELFGQAAEDGPPRTRLALVVDTETEGHIALVVDGLLGQRQVVLKSLEQHPGNTCGLAGATIMGDGRVALVLDLTALMERRMRGERLARRPDKQPEMELT
ncbi:chemotaxis protein CheA [Roseobacter sp. HKCCA0434]|uniref:chemotaxis protein CheA n=1 Tax=Roseobacter sp. HKCCA0434 TaxID=3079297 RepID=UPI002905C017|nr:chemotaxis protein CheA [Roseobacter sp. HKCCA0434]